MDIKVKRIYGDSFTNKDEVIVNIQNEDFGKWNHILYGIEEVSGPSVKHGGGADANTYLNYKNDSDKFANGVTNYANTNMVLTQDTQGDSVVRIKVRGITTTKQSEFNTAFSNWMTSANTDQGGGVIGMGNSAWMTANPQPNFDDYLTIQTSNTITISWGDDDWV